MTFRLPASGFWFAAILTFPCRMVRSPAISRIVAALPTIKKLIADGGKVILCSHLGKPKNGPEAKFSLAPVRGAPFRLLLGKPVVFADDDNVVGEHAKAAVAAMKDGDVVLLQNTRFRKEEDQERRNLLPRSWHLWRMCYVNDAFGSCAPRPLLHRGCDAVPALPAWPVT